jgi:putative solute:sodium symporter small subunit
MIRAMADEAIPTPQTRGQALLKAGLLTLWVLASFVSCFYARELQFMLAGWPFNYWMAAQGAVLCFIGIVVAYAWAMSRMERGALERPEAAADKGAADV